MSARAMRGPLSLGAALGSVGLLAGCHLPQPMYGNPGRMGAILSQPPPSRLVVNVPQGALLGDAAAALWAKDMTAALLDQTIPAVQQAPRPGDWSLQLRARLVGDKVVPTYMVLTPTGQVKGQRDGDPVPAAAWSAGDATMLHNVADTAAPRIVTILTGLRTAEMRADPNSLMNRPAKIYFHGVKGAPGNGDAALGSLLNQMLPDAHDVLVSKPDEADFRVNTTVSVSAPEATPGGKVQKVEIVWHVMPQHGVEAGAVTQLHDVPPGSLDHDWGQIALAVVTQAAPGIRTVIDNYSARLAPPPPPPAAPGEVGPDGKVVTAPDEEAPGVPKLNTDLPSAVAPFKASQQSKSGS